MTTWNPSRCTTSPVVHATGPTGPTGATGTNGVTGPTGAGDLPDLFVDFANPSADLDLQGGRVKGFRVIGDATAGISGLTAPAVGEPGRVVFFGTNVSLFAIGHHTATGGPRNNITTPTLANVVLRAGSNFSLSNCIVIFEFNGTNWSMIEVTPLFLDELSGASANGAPATLLDSEGQDYLLQPNDGTFLLRATLTAISDDEAHHAAIIKTLLVQTVGAVATVIAQPDDPNAVALLNGEAYTLTFAGGALNKKIVATFTGTAGQNVNATLKYELVTSVHLFPL